MTPRIALVLAGLVALSPRALAQEPGEGSEKASPARPIAGPVSLSAGPIQLKLENGELRYLRCRGREIVRRLYFAVRDDQWDTVMPSFSKMTLRRPRTDEFIIELEARCRRAPDIDFRWSGRIEGKDSGSVTFTATGEAAQGMRSNRIGLCVLYPTPDVLGQPFTTRDAAGARVQGAFPDTVAFPLVVAPNFVELHYLTREWQRILARFTGSTVSMEDQRNFGDTSFKAYAPLPFDYPAIPAGKAFTQSVSLIAGPFVDGPQPTPRGTQLTLGPVVDGARVPTFAPDIAGAGFFDLNSNREKHAAATALAFEFRPSLHLFDDDTYFENVPAVADMARSLHTLAPQAAIDVGPIRLDPPYNRPGHDPRSARPFGAAWAALAVKYLALGGVRAASFDLGPGYAKVVLTALASSSGQPVRDAHIASPALVAPVDGYGVGEDMVVVNKTGRWQTLQVNGLPGGAYAARSYDGRRAPSAPPTLQKIQVRNGRASLTLAPHAVCLLAPSRPR